MNRLLTVTRGKRDAAFCRGVLEDLKVTYRINGEDKLPKADDRRVLLVCNHPLGGLDGITLIDMLTAHLGEGLRFVVNDILMAIKPLSGTFLPVNKHGRQSRQATGDLDEALASDVPVMVFPAGLVSRKRNDGTIADLRWNKMFVNKAIRYHRDIIPLYFNGENSSFFYNFARLRTRLGLKFNIEMICLPREVFKCVGREFEITVGDRIPWTSLKGGTEAHNEANAIKRKVYELKNLTHRTTDS